VTQRATWLSEEPFARRRELFLRAAPVFRKRGYQGATLKELASACSLSIPGLYHYFPSKRALALFPLRSLYPELHGPEPQVGNGDPLLHLSQWVEGAVAEMPNYLLALELAREVRLRPNEQRNADANLAAHIAILADLIRRAALHLSERAARELASTMVNVALGPAVTGLRPDPDALRRELRALLRGHGIHLPRAARAGA
jgi:AcrR family transcriptional regulator